MFHFVEPKFHLCVLGKLIGKAGISSTKGTCEAASSGSRCLREKTGAYSFALYAYTSPLASNGSSSSASQQSNVALINQSSEVL